MPAQAADDAQCGQPEQSIALFQQGMGLYQKVVAAEYHDHSLIAGMLHDLLAAQFGRGRPLRVLDLGCGDGSFAAAILAWGGRPLSLQRYTAVDLSATSLELAARQPLPAGARRALVQQDMLGFMRQQAQQQQGTAARGAAAAALAAVIGAGQQGQPAGPGLQGQGLPGGSQQYDVVLSALAVHHLSQQDKGELLGLVRASLAEDGLMLYMDVFRQEGESREEYMGRIRRFYHGTWDRLTPEEGAELWDHVSVYDFPEEESGLRDMAAAAGFACCDALHTCRWDYTKVLALHAGA